MVQIELVCNRPFEDKNTCRSSVTNKGQVRKNATWCWREHTCQGTGVLNNEASLKTYTFASLFLNWPIRQQKDISWATTVVVFKESSINATSRLVFTYHSTTKKLRIDMHAERLFTCTQNSQIKQLLKWKGVTSGLQNMINLKNVTAKKYCLFINHIN